MLAKATILSAAALVSVVNAHGYVRTWTLDGVEQNGYSRSDGSPKPDAIGWSFTTPDEGPEMDMSSPAFACRQGSKSAANAGTIAAGGSVSMLWTSDDKNTNPDGWAESHRGPIITYMAPCNGDCSNVDAVSLKWTKIDEAGVSGPANTQGVWATDKMRANGGVTTATIPSTIAPGNYVLRNEIIALHRAHLSEPEFYPACANIEVTGSGSDDLSNSGVAASQLYSTSDEQIFGFSVYDNRGDGSDWLVPGPVLYSGAGSISAPGSGNTSDTTQPAPTPVTEGDATVSILPVDVPDTPVGDEDGSMSILPVDMPKPTPSGSSNSGRPPYGWRPRGGNRHAY
jgi:lytic cellulose monooxygenase (C1-hydroxylating)